MIPTVEQAREYKLNLAHFRANYSGFILNKVEELANIFIIDVIVDEMKREGFSEKIWKNTYVKDVRIEGNRIVINVISEYFSDTGFDVAIARETGTRDHWIRPKTGHALKWVSRGIKMFSKGHIVSGIKSLHIIENTIRNQKENLQREFDASYTIWLNSIFA